MVARSMLINHDVPPLHDVEDVLPRIDNVLALDCTHFFIAFLNMSDCPDLQASLE